VKVLHGPAAVMVRHFNGNPLEKSGKEWNAVDPESEDLPVICTIYSASDRGVPDTI